MNQVTNQQGINNAGRDINHSGTDPGPASFHMPETMKDELVMKAESLLFRLENLMVLKRLLSGEIESYQAGHYKPAQLQETIDFINLKLNAQ